ncbi:Uncharacterised protein (plasmid) [Legionella adelaidensis]|uniref:Uncharacterized protein n=1 Tax=Legionella adelaidensis TaxID=45056 RepID=A0A0W0R0V0_9GAMM|nr:hypothetical protein [Legionella adelaidensis]KTC64724.1 hypothetical protein Lade_2018 [Legionella adelaidensis]VEH82861.1 Uncharacterised protein [Legionella adelaidensis]
MKKKLISAIAMIIITSAAHALELHNAVILRHRTWISGSDHKGLVISAHLDNKSQTLSSSTARASTNSVYGVVNANIYTQGSHSYYVNNTSGTYQTYTVDLKLCANSIYCFHDQTHIGVQKGGYFSNNATSYLTCMFSYTGSYRLEATTSISGDTSSSDASRATIYVKRS